jgi:hypothetical protein
LPNRHGRRVGHPFRTPLRARLRRRTAPGRERVPWAPGQRAQGHRRQADTRARARAGTAGPGHGHVARAARARQGRPQRAGHTGAGQARADQQRKGTGRQSGDSIRRTPRHKRHNPCGTREGCDAPATSRQAGRQTGDFIRHAVTTSQPLRHKGKAVTDVTATAGQGQVQDSSATSATRYIRRSGA